MKAPDLGKMYGPLPLGAWIAVVGLGLGIGYVVNRRAGSALTSAPAAGTAPAPVPAAYSDPLAGFTSTGVDAQTPISAPSSGRPQSNNEWINFAASTLGILRRPYSPYEVQQALGKYLAGGTLSTRERTIVEDAIRNAGYPPEVVQLAPEPTPTTDPTATGQPGYERTPPQLVAKDKLGRRRTRVAVVNGRGETAEQIARRVYGTARYADHIQFFNASLIASRGGVKAPLPSGVEVAY